MRMITVLCLVLAAALAVGGCTQGQMAPDPIKAAVYAARADGIVTLERIRTGEIPADEAKVAAFECIERIVGTVPKGYDDGLLSPPFHWFKGTKPTNGGD